MLAHVNWSTAVYILMKEVNQGLNFVTQTYYEGDQVLDKPRTVYRSVKFLGLRFRHIYLGQVVTPLSPKLVIRNEFDPFLHWILPLLKTYFLFLLTLLGCRHSCLGFDPNFYCKILWETLSLNGSQRYL